jgi:protein-S-isoprenylcysteine O-methyltransferase Ste14
VEDVALYLWGLYGLLALVVPVALQLRRTGSTGLKPPGGAPGSVEWIAGASLIVALALGVAAPILALNDDVEPIDALDGTGTHVVGVALYALGLALVVFSQQWMGRSWRVGVDESERTELVKGGPFEFVRNPIFTGLIFMSAGFTLMVPSIVSLASTVILLVSLELQTRLVEEPYLTRVHGEAYRGWASRVGRFLPGVGRLTRV